MQGRDMIDLPNSKTPIESVPRLLLTYDQAADALAISKAELERIVGSGDIRPVRHGRLVRFTREMLSDWIASKIDTSAAVAGE